MKQIVISSEETVALSSISTHHAPIFVKHIASNKLVGMVVNTILPSKGLGNGSIVWNIQWSADSQSTINYSTLKEMIEQLTAYQFLIES